MSQVAEFSSEELALIKSSRAYRGVPLSTTTFMFWFAFVGFSCLMLLAIVTSVAAVVQTGWDGVDRLTSSLLVYSVGSSVWFSLLRTSKQVHKLSILLDKLTRDMELPGKNTKIKIQ